MSYIFAAVELLSGPGSVLFCSEVFYSSQLKTNIPSSAVLIDECVKWTIGITAAVVVKPTRCPSSLRNIDFDNVAIQRRITTRLLSHLADKGFFSFVYAAMTNGELVRDHAASK